jgi:hypothetical protein
MIGVVRLAPSEPTVRMSQMRLGARLAFVGRTVYFVPRPVCTPESERCGILEATLRHVSITPEDVRCQRLSFQQMP